VARRSDTTDGGTTRRPRATTAKTPPATRRPRSAAADKQPAASSGRAGFSGLLRGPGSVLGGLSGIDGATRSLDRLSRAADRGVDFLERLEEELGWERLLILVDRLETLVALLEGRGVLADRLRHLVHAVEGMHHSMEELESMVADLHEHVIAPPAPRRRTPAAKTARPRR